MTEIEKYIEYAKQHGAGTETGDHIKTNKAYDLLQETYEQIKSNDPELTSLIPLLQYDNDSVRLWAAYHLLPKHESIAISTLKEISKKENILALDAEMIIKEWNNGKNN